MNPSIPDNESNNRAENDLIFSVTSKPVVGWISLISSFTEMILIELLGRPSPISISGQIDVKST